MRFISIFLFLVLLFVVVDSCNKDNEINVPQENYTIHLKWNKAYETETQQQMETGFLWACSFLGADLPKQSFNKSIRWDSNILQVNLYELGFNKNALNAFAILIPQIKQSEEYKKLGAIDIGRFVMLTLNSSNHYYAITGANPYFPDVKLNKVFDSTLVAITQSTVSLTKNRLIQLPDSNNNNIFNMAFIANECEGSIANGTQKVFEYEVAELMHNGQFRFSIYDTENKLLTVSNTAKTNSGKPAKCLWCHEINIQTFHATQTDVPGYYGVDLFKYFVSKNIDILKNYRNTLQSDIDFTKTQDHTQMELVYITFMEPSAERLAMEWDLSIAEVKNKLIGIPTHNHSEFNFLKDLYHRKDIEQFSPYKSIRVPDSARDSSSYEPNLIK